MTRVKVLGAVLAVGALTVAVAAQQQARPPLPALQKVKDNLRSEEHTSELQSH